MPHFLAHDSQGDLQGALYGCAAGCASACAARKRGERTLLCEGQLAYSTAVPVSMALSAAHMMARQLPDIFSEDLLQRE